MHKNEIISSKTLLLLESLIDYYKKNIIIFTSIITQKNILSLRILDWLVTNYAKKYNIVYQNKYNQICLLSHIQKCHYE